MVFLAVEALAIGIGLMGGGGYMKKTLSNRKKLLVCFSIKIIKQSAENQVTNVTHCVF